MAVSPQVFVMFFVSKAVRYSVFSLMLYFLVSGIKITGGYTREQMIIFYLIFTFIDTFAQIIFREVYRFRPLIVSGDFDMVLAKPINPLFRSLLGGPDFIDVGILVVILIILINITSSLSIQPVYLIEFILLFINSIIIVLGFHIFALSLGILTTSVDQFMMLFRDLTSLTRIPVDFYLQPFQFILMFILPVGIIFTIPAKALFGLLSFPMIAGSFIIGMIFLILSYYFWEYSLKRYSSASS